MSKETDTKGKELVAVEQLLTPAKLKKLAETGEQGQYIKLVDIEFTKTLLEDTAKKYEGIVVTKENYKKEAKKAGQELRQSRYALQRIHKANNGFINTVKKREKEIYDELIAIIEPQEKRLADQIKAFADAAKKEKEEAEKKERERIAKIDQALKEAEFSLEKAIIAGKTKKDIEEYDTFMEELKGRFSDFEEYEFKAKRLHAKYMGRRKELVAQVEEKERAEIEKKERVEREKKREEAMVKIYHARKKALLRLGLKLQGGKFVAFGLSYTIDTVKAWDELDWMEKQEEIEKAYQATKETAERMARERKEKEEKDTKAKIDQALKDWDNLQTIYKGLGGDIKPFKIPKGQIPSKEDVKRLVDATKALNAEKRAEELKLIKEEIEPFKNGTLGFLRGFDEKLKEAKFKSPKSREVLNSYSERLLELVNEVFGEVYNA